MFSHAEHWQPPNSSLILDVCCTWSLSSQEAEVTGLQPISWSLVFLSWGCDFKEL